VGLDERKREIIRPIVGGSDSKLQGDFVVNQNYQKQLERRETKRGRRQRWKKRRVGKRVIAKGTVGSLGRPCRERGKAANWKGGGLVGTVMNSLAVRRSRGERRSIHRHQKGRRGRPFDGGGGKEERKQNNGRVNREKQKN